MVFTRKDIVWTLEKIAESAIDFAAGAVNLVPQLLLKGYVLFNFLITGTILIAARDLFLWMCPTILKLTKPIVFTINLLLDFLALFVSSCIIVVESIIDIVDLFEGHKVHNHIKPWTNPPQITDAEFRRIVSEIPPLCKQYDNAGTIVQFLARFNLHEYTCPAVRYVYPIRPIFNFLQSTLGWTYYGSASPETNVPNTNCVRSTDTPQDYICCGIGLGYLILEIFLPILLLYILLSVMGKGISNLAEAFLYISSKMIEVVLLATFAIIHELEL